MTNENNELNFSNKTSEKEQSKSKLPPWKIIISDDQEEIHNVTKLVLEDFSFNERAIEFFSAYSGKETIELIQKHPDVALVLLDVVMETDAAGFDVVRFIREELKDYIVQIVLITGQPGQAPEQEVISKYEINDYKSKTELNSRKLFTTVTASLRAFSITHASNEVNKKLCKYRDHLEKLVKERTAEFEHANLKLHQEVEERKRAENALHQGNEILHNILTTSPVGISLIENNTFNWANEEMLNLFGFESENEYKEKSLKIIFPTDEIFRNALELITETLKSGKPVDMDTTLIKTDGSVFVGHMKISCTDPSSPLNRAILTVTDISWRKQAEVDRLQKERLEGALEMSGSVCHELNQPLQFVSGSSELLMMDISKNDPIYETIGKIKEQVDRMGDITRKLMGVTSYKTRDYVGGRKIFDLDEASK